MDHFHHLDEFRLLVCMACQYAVLRPQLSRHLNDHYQELPVAQRRAIVDELTQLPVLQRDEEVRSMSLPDRGRPALPCLPVHKGYRCTLCDDYVAGSLRSSARYGVPLASYSAAKNRYARKLTGFLFWLSR
jgi:hypothetical protein